MELIKIFKNIFYSESEKRLRAGWRILIHAIMAGILLLCLVAPFLMAFHNSNFTKEMLITEIAGAIAVTVASLFARRFLDKQSFAGLGLEFSSKTPADLTAGIFIAFAILAFIFGVERALGWIQFVDPKTISSVYDPQIGLWAIIFILTGWQEELWMRGYIFKNLTEGTGKIAAIIISSLIFGILHLTNPNASPVAAIGLFFAGLFFVFAVLQTNQLWLSIGLHIGWNFFEGPVFGFPVSGINAGGFFLHYPIGPEAWTGGAFGPEAGLILLPALTFGACLITAYNHPDIRGRL